MLFTAFMVDSKLKSSTVKTYLSAIRGVLKEIKVELNEDHYLLNLLTRACKLKNDKVITKLPITKGLLGLLLRSIDTLFLQRQQQPYLAILFKAMFSAAYYGLLRIGEIADGPHVILAHNVHIGVNKQKMLFVLHTSKTDNLSDNPQIVKIKSKCKTKIPNIVNPYCPF